MKKYFNMTLAVAAFAAVGLGSYKAYNSYTAANMSEENLLLAENVLAVSEQPGWIDDAICGFIKGIWTCITESGKDEEKEATYYEQQNHSCFLYRDNDGKPHYGNREDCIEQTGNEKSSCGAPKIGICQ